MKLLMDRAEILPINMSVDLGGREIGVAEHFLHRTQVCSTLEQVSRKTVAQSVGGNAFGDAGPLRRPLHNAPGTHARQRLPAGIEHDPASTLSPVELGTPGAQVNR